MRSKTNKQNSKLFSIEKQMESEQKLGVVTFIRVIMIRRILVNDMTNNVTHTEHNDKYIKSLITEMKGLDDSMQSQTHKTLSQLITNDGIKSYFNRWDENDNNPNIIEMIFNKLILTKFVNEYEQVTTYKSKNTVNVKLLPKYLV